MHLCQQDNGGQLYHCLAADADAGSERIEFKCVRHYCLVDVPERHADYIPRAGRSVRANSHADVPEVEREVRFTVFQATLPEELQSDVGTFCVSALCGFWGLPKTVNHNSEPFGTLKSRPVRKLHCMQNTGERAAD